MPPFWFLQDLEDRASGRDKRGPSRRKKYLSGQQDATTRPSSSSTADQTTRVGSTISARDQAATTSATPTLTTATATSVTPTPATAHGHKKVDSGTTFVADGKTRECDRQRTFSGILDGSAEERNDGEQGKDKEDGGLRKKTWKAVKGVFGKKKGGEGK